jgi:hypothetical protein
MGRYRFELAAEADDADLRHVLAQTPMGGTIAVTFGREPSYFGAAEVDGHRRQVIAVRDLQAGRLVGFGSRSIRWLYVNGRPVEVGYLSGLRLLPEHRNRGLVALGYVRLRQLHADSRVRLYLTTIAEGNDLALRTLTSGRAGLPAYHPAGRYHTLALPLRRRKAPTPVPAPGLVIRAAKDRDLPALIAFLQNEGAKRQFFPCYRAEDFLSAAGALKGLLAEDLLLAYRAGRLVGTLGGWNQEPFRQVLVHAYSRPLRWARPLCNIWARLRGLPRLPAPGEPFRYLMAALPVAEDSEIFGALMRSLLARAAGGRYDYLLLGLHETDPLLGSVSAARATRYTTLLFVVCWEDGEAFRAALEPRVPYLELGSL